MMGKYQTNLISQAAMRVIAAQKQLCSVKRDLRRQYQMGQRTCALAEERGQMAVEIAVLLPVIIVVALVVVNVLHYAELCARFDRLANDAVLIQGVSPAGTSTAARNSAAVQQQLEEAMDAPSCEVEVTAEDLSLSEGGALVNLAAGTTRYTCALVFHPWPTRVSIAGASFSAGASLRHERSLVVDCYRNAIIT